MVPDTPPHEIRRETRTSQPTDNLSCQGSVFHLT